MRRVMVGIVLLTGLLLTACANRPSMGEEFDRSAKAFNRMVRWHELENAGMTYIDPELREGYLKQAAILKKRGISFTDFRILSSRFIPEKNAGDVIAEFEYFILPSNRVKTISYRQEWIYQENSKSWKLKSGLPAFE